MAKKPVLLIIDAINHFDFVGGKQLGQCARPAARNILRLRRRFDAAGQPVIHVNDNWMQWQGDLADLVEACIEAGGDAGVIAGLLAPERRHYYVLKPKNSGFMHCALPVLIAQLGCDALAITGFATDSCVLATALDAHMHDYPIWVPSDCTAAITPARKRQALSLMRANTTASTAASTRVRGLFTGSR